MRIYLAISLKTFVIKEPYRLEEISLSFLSFIARHVTASLGGPLLFGFISFIAIFSEYKNFKGMDGKNYLLGMITDFLWFFLDRINGVLIFYFLMYRIPVEKWNALLRPHFSIPWVLDFLVVLFVLDFFNYFKHRFMHGPFWRFHKLHHNQKYLTAFSHLRRHPGETFVNKFYYFLPLLLLDAKFSSFFWGSLCHITYSLYIHHNSQITYGELDKYFVSPMYHRIHHLRGPIAHSNYAVMFAFLDLFGGTQTTPGSVQPNQWTEPGEETLPAEFQERPYAKTLFLQLVLPFTKQHD